MSKSEERRRPIDYSWQELAWNDGLNRKPVEQQLNMLLHPGKISGVELQREQSLFLVKNSIETNPLSFILELENKRTKEIYAAKLLRPAHDDYRKQDYRADRNMAQMNAALRNLSLVPGGVGIGIRPILPSSEKSHYVHLGPLLEPGQYPDPRFEHLWIMHRLPQGQSLDEKLLRNRSLYDPIARAIVDLHQRSVFDEESAWRYGNKDALREKTELNLGFFLKAVRQVNRKDIWTQSDTDHLHRTIDYIYSQKWFSVLLQKRIALGHIKEGHGDLTMKNMWVSDFFRSEPIYDPKGEVVAIDAIDFNPAFFTLDELSEMAMLLTDMRGQLPKLECDFFLGTYLHAAGHARRGELVNIDVLPLLPFYLLDKSEARTAVEVNINRNEDEGICYIEQTKRNVQVLQRNAEYFASLN